MAQECQDELPHVFRVSEMFVRIRSVNVGMLTNLLTYLLEPVSSTIKI